MIADQTGTELDHVGFDPSENTQHLNLELFPSQAAKLADEGFELQQQVLPKLGPKAARATGGDSPNPYYDVFRSYSETGGIADELRAPRPRQPGRRQARPDRHLAARQADPDDQDHRQRAQHARRHAPRGALRRDQPRARVDHARGRPPRGALDSSTTRTTRASSGSWPRPSCGSCPSRTRTATTTRSRAARARRSRSAARARRTPTACGARRCATTTTTGSTATRPTASTRTATSPSSGRWTRRARPRTPPTPTTAARTRTRSPRTSPMTGCCAASSRSRTSTTTRPRSCSTARSASSPTGRPTTTRSRAR